MGPVRAPASRPGSRLATSPGNGPRAALRITASAKPSAKVHYRQTISHFPDRCDTAKSERKYAKAMAWLQKVYQHQPDLFAHWQLVAFTSSRTVGAG